MHQFGMGVYKSMEPDHSESTPDFTVSDADWDECLESHNRDAEQLVSCDEKTLKVNRNRNYETQ